MKKIALALMAMSLCLVAAAQPGGHSGGLFGGNGRYHRSLYDP